MNKYIKCLIPKLNKIKQADNELKFAVHYLGIVN